MERNKVRVQLDLTLMETHALDRLRDNCGLRSRADAVRTALAILEWIYEEVQSGRKVLAIGNDSVVPLIIPGVTVLADKVS